MNKLQVYISGALTGISNPEKVKKFYESIGLLCEERGLKSYIPHLNTDPIKNADITPDRVFKTDKHMVEISDLVVAYLGCPSLGVGMELAYAESKNIPLILLYEKEKNISRFPRGIPTVFAEIKFKNFSDAIAQLNIILEQWKLKQY
ncbi:MAG: XRE family transcriptional regulator [Cyanobacteria bacterium SBLK]|nr:XRE family transcriptional regulator [Cyanobacteria bacterium SBLK]